MHIRLTHAQKMSNFYFDFVFVFGLDVQLVFRLTIYPPYHRDVAYYQNHVRNP